jgi:hypothetical protein
MNMKIDDWSPDKLFLFAQFALFSRSLDGRAIDRDELNHYFATEHIDDLINTLYGYEKGGYFKLDITLSTGYINRERAHASMIDRADINGSSDYILPKKNYGLAKLLSKVEAQASLTPVEVDCLIDKLPRDKVEQYLRFKLTDINKQKFQDELADHIAGYQKKPKSIAPGVSTVPTRIPEFKIMSEQLRQGITSNLQSAQPPVVSMHKVTLMLKGVHLKVMADRKPYPFRKYQKKSDGYRAFNKLYTYPDEPFTKEQLNLGSGSDTALKDMPKSMGFNGKLREVFIELGYSDKYKSPTILLRKSVVVGEEDYRRLMHQLVNQK